VKFYPVKKISLHPVLLAAALFVLPAGSALAASWNFDTGTEGWTLFDTVGSGNYSNIGTGSLNWSAIGGNPGGFVSAVDPSNGAFMFKAPISGVDYSAFNGGLLEFSLQTDRFPDFSEDSVIVFKGGAANLTIVSALGRQPGVSWTDYSLSLDPNAFRLNNLSGAVVAPNQFADVLASLQLFLINGEFHSGVAETTSLDTVAFVAPGAAVPDSSDFGLAGITILAMIALRHRAKRFPPAATH
jgi:hypothetical protein